MSAPSTPPRKKKPTSGRVTPKGTGSAGGARRSAAATEGHDGHPGASSRYTPPVPRSEKITAPWVVPVMFLLLGLGVLVIILNYMDVLPGGTDNWYLIGGLGLILGGIVTATQLH